MTPLSGPKASDVVAGISVGMLSGADVGVEVADAPAHIVKELNASESDLIAKPIPWASKLLPGIVRNADVFMPTTSPARFKSGPPLLPGLIAASVWT